jgi:hypothetical protein
VNSQGWVLCTDGTQTAWVTTYLAIPSAVTGVHAVEDYDTVVIGSAVYVGHWLDAAKDLVNRCRDGLGTCPVWLFSSGPVGHPAGRLAQAMAEEPVEVAGIRIATHARDHKMEAEHIPEFFATFGADLPPRLWELHQDLVARLG